MLLIDQRNDKDLVIILRACIETLHHTRHHFMTFFTLGGCQNTRGEPLIRDRFKDLGASWILHQVKNLMHCLHFAGEDIPRNWTRFNLGRCLHADFYSWVVWFEIIIIRRKSNHPIIQIINYPVNTMTQPEKKNDKQKQQQKRSKDEDDSYELGEYDEEEQQIQDDGEQSSEHSSIDLQEYLKNRDNIPSEPSDAQDDDDQDDDQDYDDDESQEKVQKPASKKQKVQQKKQQKKTPAKKAQPQDQDEQQ